jgi:hypothetical protein
MPLMKKLKGFGDPVGVGDYVRIRSIHAKKVQEELRGTFKIKDISFRGDPEIGFYQSNRKGMWCWYKGKGWKRDFKLASKKQIAAFEKVWAKHKGKK